MAETPMESAHVSTPELAEWLACSLGEIKRLAAAGVLSRAGPDQFELKANVQAYARYQRERKGQGSHWEGRGSYATQRVRLTKLKADLAQQERDLRDGRLVEAKEVGLAWAAIVSVVRTALLGLPSYCAPRAANRSASEVAQIIRARVNEILQQLAKTEVAATDMKSNHLSDDRNALNGRSAN